MEQSNKYLSETKLSEDPKKPLKLLLKDKAIAGSKLADNSITEEKISDGSITPSKLHPNTIDMIYEAWKSVIVISNLEVTGIIDETEYPEDYTPFND